MVNLKTTFALCICILTNNIIHGQDAPSKPIEKTFGLGPDQLGSATNTVNLFTGEVSFPVNLSSIPGKNGLAVSVNIQYNSSGISKQASTWNKEAPTGITGLGWTIDQSKIIVDNKGTGTRLDDEYYLASATGSGKLIYIGGTSTEKEYALESYQFWKVRYYPVDERWEIISESGIKSIYGNINSGKSTIQWVVNWGNWIGNSSLYTNKDNQPMAFNLWKMENRFGDAIEYEYNNVDQYVGSLAGKKHTEASYISKIYSPSGEKLIFNYSTKSSNEYVEPHTEKVEPDAYQERYEKLYLNSIDAYNFQNVKTSTTKLTYTTLGTGNLTKRLLQKVDFIDKNGRTINGYVFNYNTTTSTIKGKLITVENPTGGIITYNYSTTAIQPAYSNRKLTINAPSGYAEPELHYGPDYVVVSWRELVQGGGHTNTLKNVRVFVYKWNGYWQENDLGSMGLIHLEGGKRKDYYTVTGKDFFAIARYNGLSYSISLFTYNKLTGSWVADIYNESIGQNSKNTLLAGDNYVAFHSYNDGDIITYLKTGNAYEWERKVIDQTGSAWEATGINNWIFSHNKHGNDALRFHYLSEDRNWSTKNVTAPFDSDYTDPAYWHASNSFAVAMVDNSSEYIFSWDEDYSFFTAHNVLGTYDNGSLVLISENSLISVMEEIPHTQYYININNKSVRYNGQSFVAHNVVQGKGYGGSSLGRDCFYYQLDPGNPTYAYRIKYDPNIGSWLTPTSYTYNVSADKFRFDYNFPLRAGYENTVLLDKFYEELPNGNLSLKNTISIPSGEQIFNYGLSNGSTFLVYPYTDSNPGPNLLGFKGNIIKNGVFSTSISGIGQSNWSMYSNRNSLYAYQVGQKMVFGDAFITCDNWYDFENETSLTLYKVINEGYTGLQSHYPVASVVINDRIESFSTAFEYNASSARFDPAGNSAQYNDVKIIPGTSTPSSKPFGYTQLFYNNIPSLADWGELLIGTSYLKKTFDANNNEINNDNVNYSLFSKTLSNYKFYYLRILDQSSTVDGIAKTTSFKYNESNGLLKSKQFTNQNSLGYFETLKEEFTYGFEVYTQLATENVLTPVVQSKTFNGTTVTSCSAVKWSLQSGEFLPKSNYQWKGTGSPDFTAWASTSSTDWLETQQILSRDASFNATWIEDVNDIKTNFYYGYNGRLLTGVFYNSNTSFSKVEDFNDGVFNDEPFNWIAGTGWSLNNNMLKANNLTSTSQFMTEWDYITDNYIVEFRLKFDPTVPSSITSDNGIGFHFAKDYYDDLPNESGVLFKLNPYQGQYSLSSPSDGVLKTGTFSFPNDWHSYRIIKTGNAIKVYIDGIMIANVTSTLPMENFIGFYVNKAFGYVDDFRMYPENATAFTTSFDPLYFNAESSIDEFGFYQRTLYDENIPVANINHKNKITSSSMAYSPKQDGGIPSATNLLIEHSSVPQLENSYIEDFTFGDKWTTHESNNGSTTTWSFINGAVNLANNANATNSSPDMLNLQLPSNMADRVGVEFTVRADVMPNGAGFGIGLGGDSWNFTDGGTELAVWFGLNNDDLASYYNSAWTYIKNNLKIKTNYRIKILLDFNTQKADYYVDGKLLFQDLTFRTSSGELRKISFYSYGLGTVGVNYVIDNLIIYSKPVESSIFTDAGGKGRQNIVLEDGNNVLISEFIYDALGRNFLNTIPTRISGGLDFKPNFVTSYDQYGSVAGDVNNENGHDYPSIAQKYDNSPLSRVIESGSPGYNYRLGSGNNPIFNYYNGSTSPVGMGTGFSGQYYFCSRSSKADGSEGYTFTDKSGKKVMQKVYNGNIYLTTKYEYNNYGDLLKVYPPNYFNPPGTATASSFITSNTYDFFGNLKSTTSPDNGTIKYIYESTSGRLRFAQDSNGASEGNILYWKYDELGRLTEEGYYSGTWNETTLQGYAETNPSWPTSNSWRKKYYYGTHTTFTSRRNVLTKIEINSNSDNTLEILEEFIYDRYGTLASKNLEVPSKSIYQQILYFYDNLGKVIMEDFDDGFDIRYTYDYMGRLKNIGSGSDPNLYATYEYDINGTLFKEKTNNETFLKQYNYDVTGRLSTIDDEKFKEIIGYNIVSGFISNTSFYHENGTSLTSYGYSYTYDKAGQLTKAINSLNSAWSIGNTSPNTYDANGNILTIQKNSSNKTYTYNTGTNKINRTSGSTTQYVYDGNGNVVSSTPKGLTLSYDPYFNKTTTINHSTGTTEFLYGADNERIYKKVTEGTNWNETRYIRGLGEYPVMERYTDNTGYAETRYYVYGATGLLAMYLTSNGMMLSSATLEDESLSTEKESFSISDGYGNRIGAELYNHTPGDSARYSLRLSGRKGEETGLSFIHKINKRDTVRMEVFAKYVKDITNNSTTDVLNLVLSTITTGVSSPGIGEMAGSSVTNNTDPNVFGITGDKSNKNPLRAYLNYIIYDTLFNLLDAGYVPITTAAEEDGTGKEHERLFIEKISEYDGYLQAFVSNENPQSTDVYFDDMSVMLLSANRTYYLSTDHLGSTRVLFRDDGTAMKRYDYNPMGEVIRTEGNENIAYQYTGQEKDNELGLWNYRARFYDAELGRFYGVDPQGQFASSYAGMGNNPVMMEDPDGEVAWFVPVIIGAAVGAYSGASIQSGNWKPGQWDSDWWKGAITGAFVGATVGALIAPAIGSTGITVAGSNVHTFGWSLTTTALNSSVTNIGVNAISGEELWKGALSGAASGVTGQLLGAVGVKWLADKSGLGAGFAKLGYQAASTTTTSIVSNLAGGDSWDERINIGVGPFSLTFKDGKLSKNPLDHINNLLAVVSNLRGLAAASSNLAEVRFDRDNLSWYYEDITGETYKQIRPNATRPRPLSNLIKTKWGADAGTIHGTIYHSNKPGAGIMLHENVHMLFSRFSGSSYLTLFGHLYPTSMLDGRLSQIISGVTHGW